MLHQRGGGTMHALRSRQACPPGCRRPPAAARRATARSVRAGGASGDDGAGSTSGASVAVTSSDGGGTPQDAALARIRAAKAYKQAGSGGGSPDSAPAPVTQQQEQDADAARQQYMEQLRQQQQELAQQGSAYSAFLQQQQQQQQQQQAQASAPDALDRLQQQDPGLGGPDQRPGPARPDFYTSRDAPGVQQLLSTTPRRSGLGSADEAADWLKGVMATPPPGASPGVGPALRPEEFTAAKEAAAKQRGAEIITAFPEDFGDAAAGGGGGSSGGAAAAADAKAAAADAADATAEGYQPKVTTWGVFPRPSNISEAYGGGRNIRPGQALETADQKAKREAEYASALQAYKAAMAIDTISDEELRAAQATFNEAMRLFKRGAIDAALTLFDEVREAVPLKSKLGGLSTLQAAVCYDTLGKSRQAEALYKRIQGHPTTEVSKKARQLVFGFQAMTFLKTENLSYAVKKEDYLKYFRRSADRRRVYVPSPEELAADRAEAAKAAAVAAGVVLGPVLVMGALLAGSQ